MISHHESQRRDASTRGFQEAAEKKNNKTKQKKDKNNEWKKRGSRQGGDEHHHEIKLGKSTHPQLHLSQSRWSGDSSSFQSFCLLVLFLCDL